MQELEFEEHIDPHTVDHQLISSLLEFTYQLFAPKAQNQPPKREKKLHVDPASFVMQKPLEQSLNLLEFFLLAAGKAFKVGLGECLGMLVSNAKYFRKAVLEGTTTDSFTPIG
jgi:hypothetical protein